MLSTNAKKALDIALGSKQNGVGAEVAAAIDASGSGPASHVASIGATSNLPASNAVLSTSDTYTDAAVKAAIDGAVDALKTPAESRLDAIEAKIDQILAALIAAGLMS